MTKRLIAAAGLMLACAVAGACGANPARGSSIPSPPATPAPTPAPTPTPTPAAIACGSPSPPPLFSFRVKVGNDLGYKKVLDSRPLVGQDARYCGELGFGGDVCVVRDEHQPDAVTCGNFVVGMASQTGRYGPDWFWNDTPCRGIGEGGDEPGCKQHPDNQFFVFAFGPGVYSLCGDHDRVCHGLTIDDGGNVE